MTIMNYFRLFRISHWIKNLFILLPLFFAGELGNLEKTLVTMAVIVGFSFVTSLVYVINDIFDLEFDKNHSEKKLRPISSGVISIPRGITAGLIIASVGFGILWASSLQAFLLTLGYLVLNLLYSYALKHIPIVDFVVIAVGFVLRILIGGEVGDIELTQWMLIMVFLLSLFIAVTKRRDDVYQFEFANSINRSVLDKYTVAYMDKLITIISSTLLVSYLIFVTSENVNERYSSMYLISSFLFVLIGVFRYNQITYVYNRSGSPIQILYTDTFMQITLLLWIATFSISIYL